MEDLGLQETKDLDIESLLNELEVIHAKLEKGQLSFRESLSEYEKGLVLLKECRSYLKNTEKKMQALHEKYEQDSEEAS